MEKEKCKCNEGEECICTEECNCGDDCNCGDECNCGDDCNCGDECEECDCEECNSVEQELNNLTNQIKELENKLLLEKAETINYRKRKDEEVNNRLKYASEDIIMDLLPTIDNFERAIKLDDNKLEDNLSKFLSGFKMIYCSLIKTLEDSGVVAIDKTDVEFDPNIHEGVMLEEVEGIAPNTVIEIMQKGYMLKGKVIRPAMCKVSK